MAAISTLAGHGGCGDGHRLGRALGGRPVCLIGIESQNLTREGYRPLDGPPCGVGNVVPAVVEESGACFERGEREPAGGDVWPTCPASDGSPESMRKLQLEYGAEIARAVVNFVGPLLFVVVSRYHGGAYVVFSRALNESLHATALEGLTLRSSVVGGGGRRLYARSACACGGGRPGRPIAQSGSAARSPRAHPRRSHHRETCRVAAEFDAVHTVQRPVMWARYTASSPRATAAVPHRPRRGRRDTARQGR